MASTEIDVAFERKFKDDFTLEWQQKTSLLRDTVDTDYTQDGSVIYFDFIGKSAVRRRHTVAEPTQHNPPPFSRRLIRPATFKTDAYLGDPDIAKMGRSPQNKWLQSFVAAHHRNTDDIILNAAFGNAAAADENLAETLIPLPSSQKIAAGGAGLTFAKVAKAKSMMDAAEVPLEDRIAVISPTQDNDLLNIEQATNADYVSRRIIDKGSLDGETWMGFRWRMVNRLPTDVDGNRLCLFHQKSAIGLWVPMDIRTHIARDPAHSFDHAMVVEMSVSATRVQDLGVVQVACQEAA